MEDRTRRPLEGWELAVLRGMIDDHRRKTDEELYRRRIARGGRSGVTLILVVLQIVTLLVSLVIVLRGGR